jgi:hypothetical protein
MTLRQTIQAAPAKTDEIITKLAATSNQALKTRETLFAELSEELGRYVEVEEKHLLPMLRKHNGTKTVAANAAKGNKELRARLAELAAAPKNEDAFLEKLAELKREFQSHVRDERKELLPAVLKAFDDEEAAEAAQRIEAAAAEAEEAKREEKRKAAAKAQREAERAEQAAEAEREEKRKAAAKAKRGAERAAKRAAREAADKAAETVERTAANAVEAAGAVSQSSRATANGAAQLLSVWMDWAGRTAEANAEASRRLLQVRSVAALAEAQQSYVASVTRNLIESNSAILEIARQSSKQALRPIELTLSR